MRGRAGFQRSSAAARAAVAFAAAAASAGPVLAAAGGGAEDGSATADLVYAALNFALLLGVLFFFSRKAVSAFFAERRDRIRQDLESSAELLAQAESRYASWQRQLAELEQETQQIRETAQRRAEEERDRILEAARVAAERIQNDARVAVDQEVARARDQLRNEALELAVQIAGEHLRQQIGDADRERLIDEFIEHVERDSGAAG